jgi:hypothetical protein
MLFQTSLQSGRIPLVLLFGGESSGKSEFLDALLQRPALAGSLVVANVRGGGPDGCLCCGMHRGLGDALRKIFFEALAERQNKLNRVFLLSDEITGAQLAHTLRHTPFLGQRYEHQLTFRLFSITPCTQDEKKLWERIKSFLGTEAERGKSRQFLVLVNDQEGYESLFVALKNKIERDFPDQQVLRFDTKLLPIELGVT